MVHAPNGEFWISEDYSPSILHLGSRGKVPARYVPEGIALPAAGYPVIPTPPAILATRPGNRASHPWRSPATARRCTQPCRARSRCRTGRSAGWHCTGLTSYWWTNAPTRSPSFLTRIDPGSNIPGSAFDDPAHTAPLEQTAPFPCRGRHWRHERLADHLPPVPDALSRCHPSHVPHRYARQLPTNGFDLRLASHVIDVCSVAA